MGGIYLSKSDSKHKFVKDILVKKKRRLTSCSLPAEKGEITSKKKLKITPQKDKRKMITGNHYDSPDPSWSRAGLKSVIALLFSATSADRSAQCPCFKGKGQ